MGRFGILLALAAAAMVGSPLVYRFGSGAVAQDDRKAAPKVGLEGTWEWTDGDAKQRHLLFITNTHFTWVVCDEKKVITSSAGGRWSLKDGVFTEQFEFATAGQEDLVGKEHTFKFTVEADRLTSNRISPSEQKQDWKRLK